MPRTRGAKRCFGCRGRSIREVNFYTVSRLCCYCGFSGVWKPVGLGGGEGPAMSAKGSLWLFYVLEVKGFRVRSSTVLVCDSSWTVTKLFSCRALSGGHSFGYCCLAAWILRNVIGAALGVCRGSYGASPQRRFLISFAALSVRGFVVAIAQVRRGI
ncbi:MAG: hypothetical protein M2R45_03268 [Verrucomicrobia subdivision 3 bacterium]|nr:hypothetical protein [Limisphaerales bacterium]MCS1416129.1 hypothetical protein [Limisphaerales bacterium]